MNPETIDPNSPVPLYHQIAEQIRADIEAGDLAPGDTLEPLRKAAETWNVNLHTIRHAYAALARSGLVESGRGRRRSRVAKGVRAGHGDDPRLQSFLTRIARTAEERFGLGRRQLAAALHSEPAVIGGDLPRVHVIECSLWQCEGHVDELEEVFEVKGSPWPIDRDDEPPPTTVISTYFHYNDVRRRWPTRLGDVHFLTIQPDPTLRRRLAGVDRVLVAERDASTAEAVAADLSALLAREGVRIEQKVAADPSSLLRDDNARPVLFPPRVWATLPESARRHPCAHELRYVFDRDELQQLGRQQGWRRRKRALAAGSNRKE